MPNFKTPSSCLGAGQIFVRREIWEICQFTRHDLKENVNQENMLCTFSRSISVRGPQEYFIFAGLLHNDPYTEYKYCGSQVYVPAASPGPSTVQFVRPYANRPNPHPYANHPSQSSTCTSYIMIDQIESSQVEDSRTGESGKRGKGPKKQAAKYDSFELEEERYLVNLWVS